MSRRQMYVVVEQHLFDMVVVSVHYNESRARMFAKKRAKNGLFDTAALPLVNYAGDGATTKKIGDTVTGKDLRWPRVNGCSECCDNYQPTSLRYKCPGQRGNPLCDSVTSVLVQVGQSKA